MPRRVLILLLCFTFGTSAPAPADQPHTIRPNQATTFFTGPVNDDGSIDYVAALNRYYGKGVQPEQNAFASLARLYPKMSERYTERHGLYRQRLFEHFGIVEDEAGPAYVPWEDYAAEAGLNDEQADKQFFRAVNAPWTVEESPVIDGWLRANAALLEPLDRTLALPSYYSPFIRTEPDESVVSLMLPELRLFRELARGLLIRANFAIGEGDLESAVREAQRLLLLGKHVSHESTHLGVLVGISIHSFQGDVVKALAEQGALPSDLALAYLKTYREAGEIDTTWSRIDISERIHALDIIQRAHLGLETGLDLLLDEPEDDAARLSSELFRMKLESLCRAPHFDVNRAMRWMNTRFDRIGEIALNEDWDARRIAWAEFDRSIKPPDTSVLLIELLGHATLDELPVGWTSERFTEGVSSVFGAMMLPALGASQRTENRSNASRLVEAATIALLGYRHQHGRLPESLDDLVPTYFPAVPVDPYTQQPLVYRAQADGSAIIYSLGENGKDDGGTHHFSEGDIALRITPHAE